MERIFLPPTAEIATLRNLPPLRKFLDMGYACPSLGRVKPGACTLGRGRQVGHVPLRHDNCYFARGHSRATFDTIPCGPVLDKNRGWETYGRPFRAGLEPRAVPLVQLAWRVCNLDVSLPRR